jgi:hypothetical protein
MPQNTYAVIATKTVDSLTPFVLFENISQNYTNLEIHARLSGNANDNEVYIQLGSSNTIDTNQNYSSTFGWGDGSSASATRQNNITAINCGRTLTLNSPRGYMRALIKSYSNTTNYKPILTRTGASSSYTYMNMSMWRSNNPVNTVKVGIIGGYNLSVGTTVTLYGISNNIATTRATGGLIYSDDSYYYHVFSSTGTFTPLSSLTADVLVVAGGGGGGNMYAGGGGAGGVCYQAGRSLSATGYSVTVGAGGASNGSGSSAVGNSGGNSTFDTITALGGGGGGTYNAVPGANGGSGGGGAMGTSNGNYGNAGTATQGNSGGATGYGNAGGRGYRDPFIGGGGGGAGAVGGEASGTVAGVGGIGISSLTINALKDIGLATGAGEQSGGIYYFAGGGGGGAESATPNSGGLGGGGRGGLYNSYLPSNGMVSTGGGGGAVGGNLSVGSSGGSGIVVIRYRR